MTNYTECDNIIVKRASRLGMVLNFWADPLAQGNRGNDSSQFVTTEVTNLIKFSLLLVSLV